MSYLETATEINERTSIINLPHSVNVVVVNTRTDYDGERSYNVEVMTQLEDSTWRRTNHPSIDVVLDNEKRPQVNSSSSHLSAGDFNEYSIVLEIVAELIAEMNA